MCALFVRKEGRFAPNFIMGLCPKPQGIFKHIGEGVHQMKKRSVGRPKMPDTTVINLRISKDLLERLARYIDNELRWSHEADINRATVMREALGKFLEEKGY